MSLAVPPLDSKNPVENFLFPGGINIINYFLHIFLFFFIVQLNGY